MSPVAAPPYDDIDISKTAFWASPAERREEAFRQLRELRPVSWQPPVEGPLLPPDSDDRGYWAVVRHQDVVAVSRDSETFCSGQGVMYENVPEQLLEASQSIIAMDAPRHTRLRRLVSAAFTPRQVARIEEQIARQARAIVDELVEQGDCDFVEQVSTRLPMWTISEMVGVPEADRLRITTAANVLVGYNDPDVVADQHPLQVIFENLVLVSAAALELAASRRRTPTDDLMSALVGAEIEGERLTEDEIAAFFVLLSVAGNDTTRHTISHTMRALQEFPDQRTQLVSGFDGHIETAVEEMVRWATPVMTFRRTATRDTVLCGQGISAGDKVALFYTSANRDRAAFDQPERFDIARDPNHHVGFGGGGVHYCLGAALARTQLRAIFGQLLQRLPALEVGEPHYLGGNFINGISRMPCRVGRSA